MVRGRAVNTRTVRRTSERGGCKLYSSCSIEQLLAPDRVEEDLQRQKRSEQLLRRDRRERCLGVEAGKGPRESLQYARGRRARFRDRQLRVGCAIGVGG